MFRYIVLALIALALIFFFKPILTLLFVISFLVWINLGLNPLMQVIAVVGFFKGHAKE